MMKPDRCRAFIEGARIGSDHALAQIRQFAAVRRANSAPRTPPSTSRTAASARHRRRRALLDLAPASELPNPRSRRSPAGRRSSRNRPSVACHRLPTLDRARRKPAHLRFAELVVIPELHAGPVEKGNKQAVHRRRPLRSRAAGNSSSSTTSGCSSPAEVRAGRHRTPGKRLLDGARAANALAALKHQHALARAAPDTPHTSLLSRAHDDHVPSSPPARAPAPADQSPPKPPPLPVHYETAPPQDFLPVSTPGHKSESLMLIGPCSVLYGTFYLEPVVWTLPGAYTGASLKTFSEGPFMSRARTFLAVLSVFAFLLLIPAAPAQQSSDQPWLDPSLPIDQRVDALISKMTLEEKVEQMRDHAPAIPRLGVPQYFWWNEGLHGSPSPDTRPTPQVIGMAGTCNSASSTSWVNHLH